MVRNIVLLVIGGLAAAGNIWSPLETFLNITVTIAVIVGALGLGVWLAYQLDMFDRCLAPEHHTEISLTNRPIRACAVKENV